MRDGEYASERERERQSEWVREILSEAGREEREDHVPGPGPGNAA